MNMGDVIPYSDTLDFGVLFGPIRKVRRPHSGAVRYKRYHIFDYVCAFDIETSFDKESEQQFMYIWQFQIEDITIYGRYWEEFNGLINKLREWRGEEDGYFCIYVHNLSYEWQFIKTAVKDVKWNVFALKPRKILRADVDDLIMFRCSYMLSNRSLAKFLEDANVENQKLDDFDYDKVRYPWTPLSERELLYCVNDVRGLVEALKYEMEIHGDSLWTIPLTSTGYVRREAKRIFTKGCSFWFRRNVQPSYVVFKMLRLAFRGGNTHANRFLAGDILENVYSYDRSSSYPDIMVNYKFPVFEFKYGTPTIERFEGLLARGDKAVLAQLCFKNIRLRDSMWPCPYIPLAKCLNISGYVNDNGRILRADMIRMVVTDIDYKIIQDEYEWDEMDVEELRYATYGYLPDCYRKLVNKYYVGKTSLKGVEGKEVDYMLNKMLLNSLYGMMVQNPAKGSFDLKDDMTIDKNMDYSEEELLAKAERKLFLPYTWGVWVTAWARYTLEIAIKKAGNSFVYTDTDSVKCLKELDLSEFNEYSIRQSEANGAHATDPKGNEHYMGVFEFEERYNKFRTYGAKKYVYEDGKGELHIVLAGVSKRMADNLKKLGGIEAFKPDLLFETSGNVAAKYNDFPEVEYIEREGRRIGITSNVVLVPTTYRLGITDEYEVVLRDAKEMLITLKERGMM